MFYQLRLILIINTDFDIYLVNFSYLLDVCLFVGFLKKIMKYVIWLLLLKLPIMNSLMGSGYFSYYY